MNDLDFKKGIEEIKKIGLTKEEKETMLNKIFSAPLPSPYTRFSNMFVFVTRRRFAAVALSLAAFVFLGSGIAYASNDSLPGDVLYSVKTKVVEPIIGTLKKTPIAKVKWEATKIVRRVKEAEVLAKKDQLDTKRTNEIRKNIRKTAETFSSVVKDIASSTVRTVTEKAEAKEVKERFKEELKKDIETKLDIRSEIRAEIKTNAEIEKRQLKNDREEQKNNLKSIKDDALNGISKIERQNDDRKELAAVGVVEINKEIPPQNNIENKTQDHIKIDIERKNRD